jgi:pimeloyl-ACP methyl ester carboxylesterase
MLLAFDDHGPGPVVVLIHGFPMDRSMWRPQLEDVGSMYRIIAPDLRGVGSTAVPDGVYTVDLLADDVVDTLDALELDEPVVVGGLSMGGYVALSMALRRPDRVRALILMNTRAGADSPEAAANRERQAAELESAGTPDPVVDAMIPKLFAPASFDRHPDLVERIERHARKLDYRGLANTLRGLAIRPDRTGDLGKIAVPTLVLAGAEDQIIPMSEAEALARGIPGATLVTIPDGGHLAPIEDPGAANAAILRFLGEVD